MTEDDRGGVDGRSRHCDLTPGGSRRRQLDDKPGAEDERLGTLMGRDTAPVLCPDLSAMRLDDLLGDRQSETGIVAEALVRPVGVEALENLLHGIGTDTGTVIVDNDF